jgi:hypothetical protein
MNGRANIRPFNAQVLVGNWYEDRVLEEVLIMINTLLIFIKSIVGSIERFSS